MDENKTTAVAKAFFSSKPFIVGLWYVFWLAEYNFLPLLVARLTEPIRMGLVIVGCMLIIYSIYYWIVQRHNTEPYIYSLALAEFALNKLNQEAVFTAVFKKPYWWFYVAVLCYMLIRFFILGRLFAFIRDVYRGFIAAREQLLQEKIEQLNKENDKAKDRRDKQKKQRENRSKIRKNFWTKVRIAISDFFASIIDFFTAIPKGLFPPPTPPSSDETESDNPETGKPVKTGAKSPSGPKSLVKIFIICAFVVAGLYAFFIVIEVYLLTHENANLSFNISTLDTVIASIKNSSNGIDLAANILLFLIINATILVFILIILFVVFVVIVQILKSSVRMLRDLQDSFYSPEKTNHSSSVFYALIILTLAFFVYQVFPFNTEKFANLLNSGEIIIYPIMLAVLIPIIVIVTDILQTEEIKKLKGSETAQKIKNLIFKLASGTVEAILNYLAFVTKDFLQAIQELSIDEFKEPENSPPAPPPDSKAEPGQGESESASSESNIPSPDSEPVTNSTKGEE